MKMRLQVNGRQVILLVFLAMGFASSLALAAQNAEPRRPSRSGRNAVVEQAASTVPTPHVRELGATVALLPWSYRNGKEAALQSAREACNHLLLETGFNVFLIKTATGAMPPPMPSTKGHRAVSPFAHLLQDTRTLLGQSSTTDSDGPYVLPTLEQMAAIGEKLQTRYVLAGRAQWNTRNVWVGMANRVKAICSVDVLILDMNSKRLVLDARNVVGDSTEMKNMFNTVTSAISLNPLPLVLPGSVTPQEQHAVVVATARAMRPWLNTQRIHAALAQADLSIEEAGDTTATGKFSALVSRLSALQATLHAGEIDNKHADSLPGDLTRLFALRDITLDYKEPNHLLLSAVTPKQEPLKLEIDEETQRVTTGARGKTSVQDLSEAPNRRLSLLDFCGLLTPGMFDYMRARFVRQEKSEGANLVVYDLTYWGVDDASYQRLWLDRTMRLTVRREIYDRNGKLAATYLYLKPKEVAPRTWLPTRVDIKSAASRVIASLTLANARIETETKDTQPGAPESPP